MARYANAGLGARDLEALSQASRGLEASRLERADQAFNEKRQQHQMTEWDRADAEHQDSQDYRAQRGEFLAKLAQIDPQADDYDTQRSSIYAQLPLEAQKDDAVRDIISAKDRVYQTRVAAKEREDYRRSILDERDAQHEQAAAAKAAEAGLTAEEINSFRDPATKRIDPLALSYAAGERARQMKQAATEAAKAPALEAKAAEKDINEAKILLADQKAFPRQVPQFIARNTNPSADTPEAEKDIIQKNLPGYIEAQVYDKDPYASELNSARNMSLVEYLNGGPAKDANGNKIERPGWKPDDKVLEKRRAFWEHANAGKEDATAPASASAPEVKAVVPIPQDKWQVGKRYRGASGEVKTYLGDGKWQ